MFSRTKRNDWSLTTYHLVEWWAYYSHRRYSTSIRTLKHYCSHKLRLTRLHVSHTACNQCNYPLLLIYSAEAGMRLKWAEFNAHNVVSCYTFSPILSGLSYFSLKNGIDRSTTTWRLHKFDWNGRNRARNKRGRGKAREKFTQPEQVHFPWQRRAFSPHATISLFCVN